MAMADLPLMHRWLNTAHVQQWWDSGAVTMDEVVAKYGPRIRGEQPTDPYLILYEAQSIGYIQTYRIADYHVHAQNIELNEDAAGLDLFIGEVAFVGKGLGSHVVARFVREVIFSRGPFVSVMLDPEPANQVAIRTYEKAGFRHVKTIWDRVDDKPGYIMRLARAEGV